MKGLARGLEWWMAVALGLAVGLIAVAIVGRAAAQEAPEPPAGFQLSVNQLKINQRISQAAVRRSNAATARLDVLEPKVTALAETGGKPGPKGDTGPQGPVGPAGPQGVPGSAAGYALVQADGDVVEARSKGVADANVHKPNPGVYCFKGLPTAPKAMVAVSFGAQPHLVAVNMPGANGQVDGCGIDEPSVLVYGFGATPPVAADGPFFVWFEV
jgi:hypothetical protein